MLKLKDEQIRPVLPLLLRSALCPGLDNSSDWDRQKTHLLQLCNRSIEANDCLANLTADFGVLQKDTKLIKQLFQKNLAAGGSVDSLLTRQKCTVAAFEQCSNHDKYKLLISELTTIICICETFDSRAAFMFTSELFSAPTYLHAVTDMLCYVCVELPGTFDLLTVCHAMLYTPNGIQVACKLVANNFERFNDVCGHMFAVLANDKFRDDPVHRQRLERRVTDTLIALCDMNPAEASYVRWLCVHHNQLAQLAVKLTIDYISTLEQAAKENFDNSLMRPVNGIIVFVTGLLLHNDTRTRNWFTAYLNETRSSDPERLFDSILHELKDVFDSATNPECPEIHCLIDHQCIRASGLVRVYCALKGNAKMKFTPVETRYLLLLITCFPPKTVAGGRFVSLALAMILVCPELLTGAVEEKRFRSWINWVADASLEMEKVGSESSSSFAEQLLLTAIHLLEDHKNDAVRLANSLLGVKINVDSTQFVKVKNIFTKDVFEPKKVANHAIKVPITRNMNASMGGYLPVHCVFQLLKIRTFCQGRIEVKDWIYRQVCSTSMPLHPHLQQLVAQFVQTLVKSPTYRTGTTFQEVSVLNTPFTEAEILRVFGQTPDDYKIKIMPEAMDCDDVTTDSTEYSLTTKLLMLYYALLYEEKVLNNMKDLMTKTQRPKRYASSLLSKIPVKLLLYKAQKEPSACQGLYPALVGLLINHMPHLCMVNVWINELDVATPPPQAALKSKRNRLPTPADLYKSFLQAAVIPAPALIHLRQLTHARTSADETINFVRAFTWGLPHLLARKVPRRVRKEALRFWLRLNALVPEELWVLTIDSLISCSDAWRSTSVPVTSRRISNDFEKLITDPLITLSVKRSVLECPEFLEMILHILPACISAHRACTVAWMKAKPSMTSITQFNYQRSRHYEQTPPELDMEKEQLRVSYTSAMESAAVQILIEICGLNVKGGDTKLNLLSTKREVQCLACSAIHQMFITDKVIASLVHSQVSLPPPLLRFRC